MAESPKIIENQMASVFFRQELPEYRALYSEPGPRYFQEKSIRQHLQVTGPRNGNFVVSFFTIVSHRPFQVIVAAENAPRAGAFQKGAEKGETRQPLEPFNCPEG